MAITSLELDALKPKEKPYLIREKQHNKKDGTLAFKILPNGDIDGYFIYYVAGKERLKKIGRYGKAKNMMTLKAIRDKYTVLSKEYQGGVDVKVRELELIAAQESERQKQAAIERKKQMQGSFQQLVDSYIEYASENRGKHYCKEIKRAFAQNLQGFDTTIKANEITTADISKILSPIIERGALIMANRMRSYLSAAFSLAVVLEKKRKKKEEVGDAFKPLEVRFFIKDNPVIDVDKPLEEENPKERDLNESEVYAFWHGLEKSSMSPHRKNILKLMLATGCRVEALTALRWDELDFNDRLINIPPARSKNKRHWIIPMNDIAYEILSSNPRFHDELLFPAGNGIEPLRLDGLSKATKRLCKQLNINRFTPRDLRPTFKTLGGKAGISKEDRDRIQNHALTDVSSKHYDRYDYLKEKRDAMRIWNDYLQRIIDGENSTKNHTV